VITIDYNCPPSTPMRFPPASASDAKTGEGCVSGGNHCLRGATVVLQRQGSQKHWLVGVQRLVYRDDKRTRVTAFQCKVVMADNGQ